MNKSNLFLMTRPNIAQDTLNQNWSNDLVLDPKYTIFILNCTT